MIDDERYDVGAYPDFMGMAMPFSEDLFEDGEALQLEDGILERPFLPLRDLVLFPQMVMQIFLSGALQILRKHFQLQIRNP